MRTLLVVMASLALAAFAPAYDRAFGNLLYAVPADYAAIQQPAAVTMARRDELARGDLTGALVVPKEIVLTADLKRQLAAAGHAASAQALAIAAGDLAKDSRARLGDARLVNRPQADGYEVWQVDSQSFDAIARQDRYARTVVVFVKDRAHLFIAAGYGSDRAFQAQLPGFTALLQSGEFRNQGRPLPARPTAPLPGAFPKADAPAQPPPSGARAAGRCRIVQRQMCSGGIGTSLGYFCNTYPQRVCD